MKNYFIAIAGNIGSGKTSLSRILGEKFGWSPFFESVEDNPYLADFYADMKKWSFHLQIYFLSKRFNDFQEILKGDKSIILDRTLYEDGEIFARNLYEIGMMDKRDWNNYINLYNILSSYLKPPDLMIYLRSDVDFLMERIKKRSRDCESTIEREYMEQLNKKYEDWMKRYNLSDVLVLDASKMDYVYNGDHGELIAKMIREKLKI